MQPQQPHTTPAPVSSASQRPVGRARTVMLSLLAGVVLGAAGTGAVWVLSADPASTAADGTPAADARAACAALDGFDPEKYAEKGPAGEIALNRYAAAGTLSASAAAGDPKYEELARAVRRSQERHARVFDFDPAVKKDLAKARQICRDL
ncbi:MULTISPECIES: hypothetical protein [unclassified Streptomyces]|uniref:hypothetical protein n=1 Tax=unclassified Streptomyces TaxID=2593676 RepID=UPI003D70BF23